MEKTLVISILLIVSLSVIVSALGNPAAVYCDVQHEFSIQDVKRLAKFNLCGNSEDCDAISQCDSTLTYEGNAHSSLNIDWLSLEALSDSDRDAYYDNFDCAPNDASVFKADFEESFTP